MFDKPDARRKDESVYKMFLAGTLGSLTNISNVGHRGRTKIQSAVIDVRLPGWIFLALCYGLT